MRFTHFYNQKFTLFPIRSGDMLAQHNDNRKNKPLHASHHNVNVNYFLLVQLLHAPAGLDELVEPIQKVCCKIYHCDINERKNDKMDSNF